MDHRLDAEQVHYEWNNALPPRLLIEPGDTVVFDTRDAADRYYRPTSTHADVLARGPFRGHPLTGPVAVKGARPGDVLVVEILEVKPAEFGWTAIRPGRGLLPESDFGKPFLQIWDLGDGTHARAGGRVAVPIAPFPGVMGTALDVPGGHSTMPPRKNGGNMDIKQLTAGSTLYLPVWVDGALFSVGDTHAIQGPVLSAAIQGCWPSPSRISSLCPGRVAKTVFSRRQAVETSPGFRTAIAPPSIGQ